MRSLQAEPIATKPRDFGPWFDELCLLGDVEGVQAVIGIVLHFAPVECVRYLAAQPALWAGLLARARWADVQRYHAGVQRGRGAGV